MRLPFVEVAPLILSRLYLELPVHPNVLLQHVRERRRSLGEDFHGPAVHVRFSKEALHLRRSLEEQRVLHSARCLRIVLHTHGPRPDTVAEILNLFLEEQALLQLQFDPGLLKKGENVIEVIKLLKSS